MKLWHFEFPLKRNNIASGGREEEGGFIIRTPPILKVFRGQPIANLRRWLKAVGGTLQKGK